MNKDSDNIPILLDKLSCFRYNLSYESQLMDIRHVYILTKVDIYKKHKTYGGANWMKPNKGYNKSVFRSLALVSQIGINMLVSICLTSALGLYLDKKLGTSYIVIILFFVGVLAGAQNAYRMAKQVYTKPKEDSKNQDVEKKDVERSAKGNGVTGNIKK